MYVSVDGMMVYYREDNASDNPRQFLVPDCIV